MQQLADANPQIPNLNQIFPGQRINIPGAEPPVVPPGCIVYVST